jgi:hypothetical protein
MGCERTSLIDLEAARMLAAEIETAADQIRHR